MEAVGGDDEGLRFGHDKGLSVDPREARGVPDLRSVLEAVDAKFTQHGSPARSGRLRPVLGARQNGRLLGPAELLTQLKDSQS